MAYEKKERDWNKEKKMRRVYRGTDPVAKHRKSIYNMLSEQDLEDQSKDNEEGDVGVDYDYDDNYTKQH